MRTTQIPIGSALLIFEGLEPEKGYIRHVPGNQWFGSGLQPDQLDPAGSAPVLCGLARFD